MSVTRVIVRLQRHRTQNDPFFLNIVENFETIGIKVQLYYCLEFYTQDLLIIHRKSVKYTNLNLSPP